MCYTFQAWGNTGISGLFPLFVEGLQSFWTTHLLEIDTSCLYKLLEKLTTHPQFIFTNGSSGDNIDYFNFQIFYWALKAPSWQSNHLSTNNCVFAISKDPFQFISDKICLLSAFTTIALLVCQQDYIDPGRGMCSTDITSITATFSFWP